jgi:hypothetical protein
VKKLLAVSFGAPAGACVRRRISRWSSHDPIELIAATKTKTGLTVQCAYDPNWYPTGEKISDADFESIPLRRHDWHGDWNYNITAD